MDAHDHEWQEASKSQPCPICKKGSWCRFTTDGTFANCRRVSKGGEARTYADGGIYYAHVLNNAIRPTRKPKVKPAPSRSQESADPQTEAAPDGADATQNTVLAPIGQLHDAYSKLLTYDCTALSVAHTKAMLARGFDQASIVRREYRSISSSKVDRILLKTRLRRDLGEEGVRGVPGIAGKCPGLPCGAGILVPCRDLEGRIFALKVRSDVQEGAEGSVPKIYYLSSGKHGGPTASQGAHIPLGTPLQADEVRVTEGEIKSDLATDLSGLPTISFPGVSTWRVILPILQRMQVKIVRLAFDADAPRNLHVAQAQLACIEELRAAGYVVKVERWEVTDGKGIDDVLAAGKPIEVLEGDDAWQYCDACVQFAQQAAEDPDSGESDDPSLLERTLESYGKGVAEFFGDTALLEEIADVACSNPLLYAAICEELRAHGMGTLNFRRAMKPLLAAAAAKAEPEIGRAENGGFYVANGSICRTKQTPYGPVILDLCNFTAEIVDETTLDDGAELKVVLGVSGTLAEGRPLPRIEVPAEKFHEPQKWMMPGWGSDAIVWPGEAKALPAAIQALSEKKKLSRVFTHSGWRQFGDNWAYLHPGGAIGIEGEVKVSVPESLARMNLIPAATSVGLRQAIRASFEILKLTPDNPALTYSLLGTVYRSPLGLADYSLYLVGRTGTFKTETAALAQQHFGEDYDARHLPANWSSTGNSLEGLLFHAKDMLTVIDDFAPQAGDVARLNRSAEQVFRAQGNSAGRGRMKHDGTLRQSKPPRGTVIATGEDVPAGHSILARLNVQEFSPGDVDLQQLTKCQQYGAEGLFAQAMHGYIEWLAPNYESVMAEKKIAIESLRAKAIAESKDSGVHARAPGIIAEVHYGLQKFLQFGESAGAISVNERKQHESEGWETLVKSSVSQAGDQDQCEPAAQFIRLITSAIATGRAHLVTQSGKTPDQPMTWGWRINEVPVSTGGCREDWRPIGRKVGWLLDNNETLLLDVDAAYAEAQQLAEATGCGFAIKPVTLSKRLNERGFLVSTGSDDGGRQTLKVRHTCEGRRVNGLELKIQTLCESATGDSDSNAGSELDSDPDSDLDGQVGQVGQVFDAYQAVPYQETCEPLDEGF
jgi:hypothetical protein